MRLFPRSFVAVVLLMALVFPVQMFAVVPIDSGTPSVVLPVTINAGSGDQYDPHVSGDLVSYTDEAHVRYYDFFTGTDAQIPAPSGFDQDLLSDVNNGRIVFSRVAASGTPIMLYDVGTASTIEVDPQYSPLRYGSAIGADTVAFIDYLAAGGELFISQLGGATVRVTNDARTDQEAQVAPFGNVVVYESCGTNCDIRQAAWNGTSWIVTNLTDTGDEEHNPDTDGTVVVYDALRGGDKNICWMPVGGGSEQCLELAGAQRNPSVSGGLIAFESIAVGETAADLFVYQIATNRLFRITSTPDDDSLNDGSALTNGQFHVAWSSGAVGSRNVQGVTIELPAINGTFNFSGFLQPVDAYPTFNAMKAGGAVPVRFSLGGFQGLGIFAAGYPKSQTISCSNSAPQDEIEQTATAGGSSLSYDATTDQYSYIWKTDRSWAGTCRQLIIRFTDNTDHYANFRFK